MTEYRLTPFQKQLLASIVPGLEDGTIGGYWQVSYQPSHIAGQFIIVDISGSNIDMGSDIGKLWRNAAPENFDEFVYYKFFIERGRHKYSLRKQTIIDAVKKQLWNEAYRVGENSS